MTRFLLFIAIILTAFLLGFAVYWKLGVYDNEFTDCLLRHRDDYHLLTPREIIHEACRRNLNPFHL